MLNVGKWCLLSYWFCSLDQRDVLAVPHAGDVADETAVLIGDTHLDGGNLVVVGNADSLGGEGVAQTGAGDEHQTAGDAEGKLTAVVHECSDGEVGQREEGSALTHVATVEMSLRDCHHRYGVTVVNFRDSAARKDSKAICAVQQFLDVCGLRGIFLSHILVIYCPQAEIGRGTRQFHIRGSQKQRSLSNCESQYNRRRLSCFHQITGGS